MLCALTEKRQKEIKIYRQGEEEIFLLKKASEVKADFRNSF